MTHRHLSRQEPATGATAGRQQEAQIGPTAQQKSGGGVGGDTTGQLHHVQVIQHALLY